MKNKFNQLNIILILLALFLVTGCEDINTLADQMQSKYDSLPSHRLTITLTDQFGQTESFIKTIKKPDKIKIKYLSPEYLEGDLIIIDGDIKWVYDKSKDVAYEYKFPMNIGEKELATPDLLGISNCLIENTDTEILDNEIINGRNTSVIDINYKKANIKERYWIDEITYLPLKIEHYYKNKVTLTEEVVEIESNIDIADSEFSVPEDIEIIKGEEEVPVAPEFVDGMAVDEKEIIQINHLKSNYSKFVGFDILLPSYSPEGFYIEGYIGSGRYDFFSITYTYQDQKQNTRNYDWYRLDEFLEMGYLHLYKRRVLGIEPEIIDINGIKAELRIIERESADPNSLGKEKNYYLLWKKEDRFFFLQTGVATTHFDDVDDNLIKNDLVKIAESIDQIIESTEEVNDSLIINDTAEITESI